MGQRRQRNPFAPDKFWLLKRLVLVALGVVLVLFLMNRDVSLRAEDYARNRPPAWKERPSIVDRLCFRRYVWLDSKAGGQKAGAYKIDLFGINRVIADRQRPESMILVSASEAEAEAEVTTQ